MQHAGDVDAKLDGENVPACTLFVSPRERNNVAVTSGLDRVKRVVASAREPLLSYAFGENRTGLIGAVSGRRSPEP